MLAQVAGIALDDATMASVVAALGSSQQSVEIDRARIKRQIHELALEHVGGRGDDDTHLAHLKALREQRDAIVERTAQGQPGHRAVEWLRAPKFEMARPTGVGRAITAYDMPIEGRDEWLAAARRLA